jgi:GAF domain-containing protein
MKSVMTREELERLSSEQLADLVLDLQHRLDEPARMHKGNLSDVCVPEDESETSLLPSLDAAQKAPDPYHHYQEALHAQTRRATLLAQIAIELNEAVDVSTIIERVLRVTAVTLNVKNVSIMLVSTSGNIEQAHHVQDNHVEPMSPELPDTSFEYSIVTWVLRYDQSVMLSDVASQEHWRTLAHGHQIGSAIALPIKQGTTTRGVLTVTHEEAYYFNSHDLLLLEGIVAQVSVALSAQHRRVDESRRREHALTLLSTSQYLTAERSLEELAMMLQTKSVSVFDVDYGLLLLAGDHTDELNPILPSAIFSPVLDDVILREATTVARHAWQTRGPAVPSQNSSINNIAAFAALPLIHNGKAIGAIVLIRVAGGTITFSANTWSLLTVFTSFIASTCANMQLVGQLRQYNEALEELVQQRTRQLQNSRDILRTVFDNEPTGMLLIDTEERVLAANNAFCKGFIAQHPRTVVGEKYATVWELLKQHADVAASDYHPHQENTSDTIHHWFVMTKNQRQHLFERVRLPVYNQQHTVVQYLESWRKVAEPDA